MPRFRVSVFPVKQCCLAAAVLWLATAAIAADLSIPAQVPAGTALSIPTTGSGDATLYLVGPDTRIKQKVRLGEAIQLKPEDLRQAGRYTAVVRGGETVAKDFFVVAAQPANLNFLAQPSRVPADRKDVISGTTFVFDRYRNLVLAPTPVKFELTVEGAAPIVRNVTSRGGVAWTRMDSSRRAGNAQFVASITGDSSVDRVVQQVAAEPCNLRIHAQPGKNGIVVETDPVRDCAGNPVPDGTIVTFTSVDPEGKSTVDARIKRGIARAELPATSHATITVASGVVIGNEIRWGGGR